MKGGDISNEVPQRIAVTLDCILDKTPTSKRVLGISVFSEEVSYNRQALARFWNFAQKYGYVMELVGFGYTRKEMKEIMDDLDNLGTNPFNYSAAYKVISDFSSQLPYRPELKHVVDIPTRGLMYGSWYLEMGAL